jgi:FkbM family methyltransferase
MNDAISDTSATKWGDAVPGPLVRTWMGLCRSLPAGAFFRRIGLWLRRPLKYGSGGPIDTRLWGLNLRLNPRGNLSEERWLFLPQFSDAMERRMLVEVLKPGSVFLDVGANAGFYSFWVWSHFKDAVRIEAFEPDPELCSRIRFNLAANGIHSLHLNPIALSDQSGTAHLAIGAKNRGTNRLETGVSDGVSVEMIPLADFVAREGISRIDAMKIDVEGHEDKILGHFFAHAPREVHPRLLICETLDKGHGDDPLRNLIENAGYRPIARGRMNTVFQLDA